MKKLTLTNHARDRIEQHGLRRYKVLAAWRKARSVDLSDSLLKNKWKYGAKQKNTRYFIGNDILFTVLKRNKDYLCLTITPK